MSDVHDLDARLNEQVLSGQILEAFERFYDDAVEMQEGSQTPTRGKDANRAREQAFVESLAEFHGAAVTATAAAGSSGMAHSGNSSGSRVGSSSRSDAMPSHAARKRKSRRVAPRRASMTRPMAPKTSTKGWSTSSRNHSQVNE